MRTTKLFGTMSVIYKLALTGGNYYVGETAKARLHTRFLEHCSGQGAAWTRTHAPLKVVSVSLAQDAFSEERAYLEACRDHGPERVRGASHAFISWASVQHVQRQIAAPTDSGIHRVLYAVHCETGRAYVDRCIPSKLNARITKHRKGMIQWTAGQGDLIFDARRSTDPLDVEIELLRLASKYGVENVRGGSFLEPEPPAWKVAQLQRQIDHARGLCLKCGNAGHYATACKAQKRRH